MDVEWAGAVAKGATIDFVVSGSTNSSPGVDLSAEYIVDNDVAPVMSESYGACELDMGETSFITSSGSRPQHRASQFSFLPEIVAQRCATGTPSPRYMDFP